MTEGTPTPLQPIFFDMDAKPTNSKRIFSKKKKKEYALKKKQNSTGIIKREKKKR